MVDDISIASHLHRLGFWFGHEPKQKEIPTQGERNVPVVCQVCQFARVIGHAPGLPTPHRFAFFILLPDYGIAQTAGAGERRKITITKQQ